MPVEMGSAHVKVQFAPHVEESVRALSEHAWDYMHTAESVPGSTYEELDRAYDFIPFKVRHYLKYCADRAVLFNQRHNYRNVTYYRLPSGCWTPMTGGFSFVLYPKMRRATGIFQEEYHWPIDGVKGTLVLTEARPGQWISSVKVGTDE